MKSNEWINIDITTTFMGYNIHFSQYMFFCIFIYIEFNSNKVFLCSLPYYFSTGLNLFWVVLLYPCEIMHILDSLVYMYVEYLCMKLIDGVTSYPFKM